MRGRSSGASSTPPGTHLRAGHRHIAGGLILGALIAVELLLSQPVAAATRTWTGLGATNNWTEPANWSGSLVPGAADLATFDGTSVKNVTINGAVSVAGISIGAGYTGVITQGAGFAVTVGATGFSQADGVFTGTTGAITVNGPFTLTLGSFTATSSTLSVSGGFTHVAGGFANGGGTVSFGGGAATIDVPATETFNNMTFAAGAKTISGGDTLTATGSVVLTAGSLAGTGTLAVQGNVSQASTYGGGTATIAITGAGAQTFTGAATTGAGNLPPVVINKPSGTLTLAGTIRTANNWTYTAGTVDPAASTVVLAGGTVSGSHSLNAVDLRATTSIAAGTTLTVAGSVSLTGGALNGTGTLAAQGPISQASTSGGGTATLAITGAGAQTFTGAATTGAGNLPPVVINKPAGTLTLAGTIRTANNWTYTAGTVDPGTATVVFAGAQTIGGSQTLTDVVFNNTTVHTITAGDTLTVTGTLSLNDGSIGTGTVAPLGPINQASAFDGGTGTLLINGAGAQTLTGASTPTLGLMPLVVINKASGTLSLAGTIRTANNWTYIAGTVDPGTATVVFAGAQTIGGSQTLTDVVFNNTTVHTITAGDTLTVTGTLSLNDGSIGTGTVAPLGPINQASAFDGGTGTLLINGAGAQTLTGASTPTLGLMPLVVINKASGTLSLAGTIRTANNWTYIAGTVDPGTSTIYFAGGTITGSQTLNAVDFRATTSIAAGTTLTVAGATTLTAGSLNGTGTLAAQGDLSQALGYSGGTATLAITGTGAQTLTGASTAVSGQLPVLVINKPSGTLTMAGTIRTANNWTYTAGTVDPGTSTIYFAGGTITGNQTLNIVDFRATTSITVGTTLTAAGSVSLTSGSLNGTGTLAAEGDVSQALGYGSSTATLALTGSGAQTLTGASTTASGDLPLVVINKPSGTLSLAGTIRTSHNWTYVAGALNPGASTLYFAGGTISGSHTLNAVDFRATTSIAAGTTLTVAGNLSLTSGAINGTGTVAAQGNVSQASTTTGGTATLAITGAGAQTFTGAATTGTGNLPLFVINKPAGTLTLAGTIRTANNWTHTAGTVDPGASTVVFAGGTITGTQTLNAVDIRATTSIAAGTTLTVAGSTTLTAGSLNGTGTLAAQGDVGQALGYGGGAATLAITGAGSQTLTGFSTTASGGLPVVVINKPAGTLTLAGTIRTANSWTYTAGTVDPGTSTVVFAGTLNVNSAGSSFYNVTTSAGTTTLGTAMVVVNDLTVSAGTFTTSASGYGLSVGRNVTVAGTLRENASAISIKGDLTNNGSIVQGTSTVNLTGSAGQTIAGTAATTSFNLVIDDPAGVTLAANLTVTGTLTLTNGPLNVATRLLTISNPLAGTTANLVAGSASSIAVTGTAAGITLPGTISQLNNLTLNNASGLAVSADLTIGGTLTLTSGPVTAGANTIVVAPGATVVRTGGRVAGALQKHVSAGPGIALAFEIGDATRYTPVSVTFGTVTTPGELTARTTLGDHPDIANSGLPAAQSVNRYWTVANSGVVFDTYDAQFTFVAADVDAGANTGTFVVAKLDGTTWTRPTVGTRTAVSTQATGMTAFSDFAVGEPTADLAVSVTDGLATVVAGDGLSHGYTITITNGGPSDAAGVTLTTTWPAGFSQGGLSPSQGTCAPVGPGPDFSCALGTIAAGASATVSVGYTVGAAIDAGSQTVAVAVASSTIDPIGTNDSATDATTVVEVANLVVTTDDGLASVVAGDGLTHGYTITITNNGPSDADSVVLDDIVPAAFGAGIPSADLGGDCTTSSGNMIHCTLPASLAPGATWTITIPYTVAASVPGQTVTNTATALSDENPGGVADGDATDVTTSADLAVSVTDGLATVVAGDGLSHGYTITITNGGPSDAAGVTLTTTWPAGFSQGGLSPSQGTCAPVGPGPDFSCALGTIAAGASATVSVGYTVGAAIDAGSQTVAVAVASSTIDPIGTNDSATDATTVVEVANLVVTTDDGLASVVAGDGLTHGYTITITNNGPSDADSVVLDDIVPAAFGAGIPSADLGGDCTTSSGNTIHCTLPASLAPGATWTITIPYTVAASVPAQTVTNTATALSDENPSGVTGSDSTTVTLAPTPTPTPTPTPSPSPSPSPSTTPRPTAHTGGSGSGDPEPSPSPLEPTGPYASPSVTPPPRATPAPSDIPPPSASPDADHTPAGTTGDGTDPGSFLPIVGASILGAILLLLFGIGRRRRRRTVNRFAARP